MNIQIQLARKAQRQRLLEALRKNHVSTIQARRELDILHPAGSVKELREKGFEILTLWQWEPTDSGKRHKVGLYALISEPKPVRCANE